ncbi:MAG: NAD(P)H-dependent oxidoreductase subunit E [Bacillota bacterium]
MSSVSSVREQYQQLDSIIEQWKDQPGGLLPIMQHTQVIFGCVDEKLQQYIAEKTDIPVATIYGVSTFYSQFTLKPRGKNTISVCTGTACYVRGAQHIMDELNKLLGVEVGHTTKDGLFTLEATRCIGCCGLAPAMMVNDQVFGRLKSSDIADIISNLRESH